MTKDLTALSDEGLRTLDHDLQMDSEHYQDREQDFGEDHASLLRQIGDERNAICEEMERREA